jgi:ferric-dicitrate binding protein FerR (iron transport regulator)
MARKKIKLQEEAISEILVADTDWESGVEASDVKDNLEEEEEEEEEKEEEGRRRRRKVAAEVAAAAAAAAAAASLSRSCHNKHWPVKSSTQLCCRLCSSRGQRKGHTVCQM